MDAFNTSRKFPKPKSAGGSLSPVDSRLNADSSLIRYLLSAGGYPLGNRTSKDAFSPPSIGTSSSRGGSSGFGRSSPPLSRIENLISPPVPAKVVDENLWVMDDIFVDSSSGGRFSKSVSSDSSGSPSNSRGFKMELCRSWEGTGHCRSGSKCQFAHGKEELRPSFFSIQNKPGTPSMKSYNSASSSNSIMSHFSPPVNRQAPMETSPTASFFRPESTIHSPAINSNKIISPMHLSKSPTIIKPELCKKSPLIMEPEFSKKSPVIMGPEFSKKSPISSKAIMSRDWLPSDDGIEVRLPGSVDKHPPSDEDVEAYIRNALYGPPNRRRLPVFTEFCPR